MKISSYFVNGEIGSDANLIPWLAEEVGLYGTPPSARIALFINSPGGDVLHAFEVINLMRSSPVPIYTIINGSAESAALLIAMAGHKRAAFKNSFAMAHHISTAVEGSYHQIQKVFKQLNMFEFTMTKLYKEFTKASDETISTLFLGPDDTYLTSFELLEHGIIDTIIEPQTMLQEFLHGKG